MSSTSFKRRIDRPEDSASGADAKGIDARDLSEDELHALMLGVAPPSLDTIE